jgi:arginyl-tRNA--protein-N-Asp/Glu arginylyltransferase
MNGAAMFAQIAHPEKLAPDELDGLLANGWFRMRQTIFTTNFLHFNHQFYSAIWLRVAMAAYKEDKKFKSLQKLNKSFRIEIKKSETANSSIDHERLFQQYRQSISFEVSPSLQELLFNEENHSIFNTHEVNIFDGNILIAVGFFDLGENAAAGITCIYHPAYKKHSLGKYLMYLKMDFCQQRQLQYFYPGYFVPGYAPFEYKLSVGKAALQYLQLASQQWLPLDPLSPPASPLQVMVDQLMELQQLLKASAIRNVLHYYRFFEANLNLPYLGGQLFDFPVFLHCFPEADSSSLLLVVFNVGDSSFHLLQVSTIIELSKQQESSTVFEAGILKESRSIFVTARTAEMASFLSKCQARFIQNPVDPTKFNP